MKKTILTIFAIAASILFANAQQVIELPFSKGIIKNDSKWGKWDSKWNSEVEEMGSSPLLIIRKVDKNTFSVLMVSNFPESMTGVFENVIYDKIKTNQIREKNSNPNLNAYKYANSSRYLWTDNVTLDEIYQNQSKWNNTKNAKIYFWDKNGASLYTSGASLTEKNINVNY